MSMVFYHIYQKTNEDFDIKMGCCYNKHLKYVSTFAIWQWVETTHNIEVNENNLTCLEQILNRNMNIEDVTNVK